MQVQRIKTCFIYHIYLKSMKQKMYSLDINVYDKYLLKSVQDHARKSQ